MLPILCPFFDAQSVIYDKTLIKEQSKIKIIDIDDC
jgi:hypothetical protein